jgi:uncharacterized membrane protein
VSSGPIAAVIAWDLVAILVLALMWRDIGRADPDSTAELASRPDPSRNWTRVSLLVASVVSIVGVAYLLHRANDNPGDRLILVVIALVTLVLSWLVTNTAFTLHYAHLYYSGRAGGIDFGEAGPPDFRDFAYLAFTLGMTYQVSDTVLRDRTMRRTALQHGLLAYLFGVVIISTTVNLVVGFL